MNYINLMDMSLSQIVLGTDGYGTRIDEKTAFELMDFYIGNGGNVLDTARMYTDGRSERIVGAFISRQRENICVSTKCGFPADSGVSRLREGDIIYDAEASLRAL